MSPPIEPRTEPPGPLQRLLPWACLSAYALIALALLTLAYLPEPPILVLLEEPDRGLHPRLLRDIRDALYRLTDPRSVEEDREPVQVVATTHSPYFLERHFPWADRNARLPTRSIAITDECVDLPQIFEAESCTVDEP